MRILGVCCPFTDNSRPYNSMLCVVLLRILGSITLCMLSWDLQLQACYFFTEDPRQSYKSSNMLPVRQIIATCYKLDKLSTAISFLGAYSICCIYFFLVSMRLSLDKKGGKKKRKKKGTLLIIKPGSTDTKV